MVRALLALSFLASCSSTRGAEVPAEIREERAALPSREVDPAVLIRQIEVLCAQLADVAERAENYRTKLQRVTRDYTLTLEELEYCRMEGERIARNLAEIEARIRIEGRAREPGRGCGRVTQISRSRVRVDVGKDDGIRVGDVLAVRHDSEPRGLIHIEAVEPECSHGRMVMPTGAVLQGGWIVRPESSR